MKATQWLSFQEIWWEFDHEASSDLNISTSTMENWKLYVFHDSWLLATEAVLAFYWWTNCFPPAWALLLTRKERNRLLEHLSINHHSLNGVRLPLFSHILYWFLCLFVLLCWKLIWEWLVKARCVITPSHTKWPKTWVKSHISSALSPARWIMSYMFSAPQNSLGRLSWAHPCQHSRHIPKTPTWLRFSLNSGR